jgi:hypothetical protein
MDGGLNRAPLQARQACHGIRGLVAIQWRYPIWEQEGLKQQEIWTFEIPN